MIRIKIEKKKVNLKKWLKMLFTKVNKLRETEAIESRQQTHSAVLF